ncbi:hypothetical protein RMCBS344292_03341 [Rhizopus microsporus]|nr:hypothetical protein RMCBS344292_03341 [Rhizopus microsporus]
MPDHPLCYMDRRLPLRCRLRISDTSSYLQQIQHVCQRIREYNSGKNQGCIIDQKESVQDTVHIEDTTNPFHLPPWSEDRFEGEFLRNLKQFLELTNNNSSDIIPTYSTFVVLNYTEPIQAWCPMLNESYMSTFLHEFKLQYHLSLLHDTFLLGNSAFVSSLESMVFESTRKIGLKSTGKWSSQLFDLNLALRSILLETVKEDELFAFSVEKAKVLVDPNAFNAFGFLKLHYDARYPLNMVITSNVQLKYNRIFIFLLQLFRVTSTVKRIYSVLRTNELRLNGDTLSRLYQYRFQFDQFLRSLQGYVHDTVINETWHIFMDQIQELNRKTESSSSEYVSVIMQPHIFKSYHEHILDRILYQCFLKQSQQRIFQTLQPILEDMLMFANVIDSYCYSRNQQEDKLLTKCHHIFKDFQRHVRLLVCVLKVLEEKGTGRLGNILNSTNNEFRDLYGKHEAKKGLDVFVKDLLTRIDLNMYYEKSK